VWTIWNGWDQAQARRLEPALRVPGLSSPSTGIDSHALMLAYQGEAEGAGATVVLRTPVLCGAVCNDGFELVVGGDDPTTISCRILVNAAGLFAPASAHAIAGIPPERLPSELIGSACRMARSSPAMRGSGPRSGALLSRPRTSSFKVLKLTACRDW
jgi:L-2-hydroxyglutarate oxidase LhgO